MYAPYVYDNVCMHLIFFFEHCQMSKPDEPSYCVHPCMARMRIQCCTFLSYILSYIYIYIYLAGHAQGCRYLEKIIVGAGVGGCLKKCIVGCIWHIWVAAIKAAFGIWVDAIKATFGTYEWVPLRLFWHTRMVVIKATFAIKAAIKAAFGTYEWLPLRLHLAHMSGCH